MAIPKIIHQTWKNKHPHPALTACIESFRFLNPGWDLRYYTDDDCNAWVQKHCPEFMKAYLSYSTGIHRADFFRILVLYFEGGVYADIDVECIRPLDELVARLDPSKTVFLTRDHPVHERAHFGGRPMWMNDFMIAEPGDPLVGEILQWLLHSPPSSTASSNAVMETGPGVISSVIEMLGGVDQVPSLGLMPTPWIHGLPDMNCAFDEKYFYTQVISSRAWLKRDVYVIHYWFHTWVGAETNTLTDFADVLLSTLGEQVERKLQWLLGPEPAPRDVAIACALAEFAESRGVVILCVQEEEDAFMDRFMEMLDMAGLRPRLYVTIVPGSPEPLNRLQALEKAGAEKLRGVAPFSSLEATGWAGRTLVVCPPGAAEGVERMRQGGLQDLDGFILGPALEWGQRVTEEGGVCFTEVVPKSRLVPRTVHLMPNQGCDVQEAAAIFAEHEFSIRHWNMEDVGRLLREASLGTWDMSLLSEEEASTAAALAVLYTRGGVMFGGPLEMIAPELPKAWRQCFFNGQNGWLLACPPRSDLLKGALKQWLDTRRRNRAPFIPNARPPGQPSTFPQEKPGANGGMPALPKPVSDPAAMAGKRLQVLPEFLQARLDALHKSGQLENLSAGRLKAHSFSL